MLVPQSIDHLVFRIANLATTERFYTVILGNPTHQTDSLMYMAGNTRLFFTIADPARAPYDKEQTGLNHLAFAIPTLEDLQIIQTQLNAASITNSGIQIDQYGLKEFIWLDDPDGLRIEFYLRQK
jgi:glyoxylase I family protein